MRRLKFAGLWPLLAAAAALLSGCGSGVSLYPAQGKITYSDGSPVPGGARLIFEPKPGAGYQVWGDVRTDGTFRLVTADERGNEKPGAPVGTYRVYVVPVTPAAKGDEGEQEPVEMAAEKYGAPDTSDISVEIKARDNTGIKIEVERPEMN